MKSKISIASFFVFLFVSSASFAQYKYDIGLRASTFELERFQLDARFHFDSPYSLLFSISTGSQGSGNYSQSPVYNDSLINVNQSNFNTQNNTIKFGVQRKLGFLATDVFYAGASVGFGFDQRRSSNNVSVYTVETDSSGNLQDPSISPWEYQSTAFTESNYRGINAQLSLSFGMDVPISKRFSINAELSFAGIYNRTLDSPTPFSIITLQPSVSGGIRYSFGKRAG